MKIFNVFYSWYKYYIILKYSLGNIFFPLGILNVSIKSFINPFVDNSLTCVDSLFNSFLFDVTSFGLLSKSVLFTRLELSLLLVKFARFNLNSKIYFVNLLNSVVVTYLLWLWSVFSFQFH